MQKVTHLKQQKNASVEAQSIDLLLEQRKFFEVMYIQNSEDQSVEVYESTVLDFNAIIDNLNEGNSVFITKRQPREDKRSKKEQQKHCYINHL